MCIAPSAEKVRNRDDLPDERKRLSHQDASKLSMRACLGILSIVTAAGLLSGCTGGQAIPGYQAAVSGSPQSGRAVMEQFRCGKCHMIPGIPGAHGVFGPPLNQMARRTFIAGEFPNTPRNLAHWVQAPTTMKPKTAMPDLGLTDQQATNVVAYLETLR